jgi:riboflavin synthase
LGGHLVQGHVDGIGKILSKEAGGANVVIDIGHEPGMIVIMKGGITVDGISLTVNQVETGRFSVALIPHTLDHTTLGQKAVGAPVNLEADMIGKYVESLLAPYRP